MYEAEAGRGGLKVAVGGGMGQDRKGGGRRTRRSRKMGTAGGSDAGEGRRQHGIRSQECAGREWDSKSGGYNDGGRRRGWEWVS